MAKRSTVQGANPEPPKLLVSKEDAKSKIQKRIDIGNELCKKIINTENEYEQLRKDVERYNEYNHEMLNRMFTNQSFAKKYDCSSGDSNLIIGQKLEWRNQYDDEKKDIFSKVNYLESILERLELIPTIEKINQPGQTTTVNPNNRKIFVVHGHDSEPKQAVAYLLKKLNLEPIILHEKPNEGKTIIEKFETHSGVNFAVVLLTPDDQVSLKPSSDQPQYRARQNVILELGYFLGKLGRNKVCVLHKSKVELPSDMSGILYVPYNENDWKFQLAKEIKKSGIEIDMNKLT